MHMLFKLLSTQATGEEKCRSKLFWPLISMTEKIKPNSIVIIEQGLKARWSNKAFFPAKQNKMFDKFCLVVCFCFLDDQSTIKGRIV